MSKDVPFSQPVEDSVPKVDHAVAVGEDLDFQRRWWKFETWSWRFFCLVLLADLLGLFGRGLLAKAERTTSDGTLDIKYERIERASTPSIMTINFGPAAIRNGEIQLYVSNSLLRELGTQRVVPQPSRSVIGANGVTYTFPVSQLPAMVELELEPSFPGLRHFSIRVPGGDVVQADVVVVP